eukprot:1159743-Pelagomonas_calceolata.AAC.9
MTPNTEPAMRPSALSGSDLSTPQAFLSATSAVMNASWLRARPNVACRDAHRYAQTFRWGRTGLLGARGIVELHIQTGHGEEHCHAWLAG